MDRFNARRFSVREEGGQVVAEIEQPYASGRWLVNPGSDDEFIERWTTFTQWSLENIPGARSYMLLRDDAEARKFLSLGLLRTRRR